MIHSMTAFAGARQAIPPVSVTCEIRGCNSKSLDISLRLTSGYVTLEEKIKSLISEKIRRGRLDVQLQISETADVPAAFELDEPRARAYYHILSHINEQFSLHAPISLDVMVAAGIIKPADPEKDMNAVWAVVEACLSDAIRRLIDMREQEGAFLAEDIRNRLALIETHLTHIQSNSEGLLEYYRDRLIGRIQKLTQGLVDIDPGRLVQEAAFLADRSDISEEIVRAGSHIRQFRLIMDAPEPAGRKLNFLLQEMNREFNTMGSKTESASVSYSVVEVKTELEKIREQVQNIE